MVTILYSNATLYHNRMYHQRSLHRHMLMRNTKTQLFGYIYNVYTLLLFGVNRADFRQFLCFMAGKRSVLKARGLYTYQNSKCFYHFFSIFLNLKMYKIIVIYACYHILRFDDYDHNIYACYYILRYDDYDQYR